VHEAPRGQVLLIGIMALLLGGLLASNFRGLRDLAAWSARRELLPEPLDREVLMKVAATIVGVAFAAGGVIFLLSAFGIGPHVYANCPPNASCR
jgi:hypothetical protein